jgi:hypothetical protein
MDSTTTSLAIVVAAMIGIMVWNKSRSTEFLAKTGEYSDSNAYINVSPLKHDLFKQTTVNIFPVVLLTLILGIASPTPLFSTEDFFGSIVGQTALQLLGYILFYNVVQPYLVNALPHF